MEAVRNRFAWGAFDSTISLNVAPASMVRPQNPGDVFGTNQQQQQIASHMFCGIL